MADGDKPHFFCERKVEKQNLAIGTVASGIVDKTFGGGFAPWMATIKKVELRIREGGTAFPTSR
jgi:hypothetical protein